MGKKGLDIYEYVDGLVYKWAGYRRAGVQKGLGYRKAGDERARIHWMGWCINGQDIEGLVYRKG